MRRAALCAVVAIFTYGDRPHLMAEDYALASWYGPGFDKKLTASGSIFDQMGLSAAHKTLPLGTKLRLYNPDTKKAAVVTVNDRGPYVEGRDLDLSKGAAAKLGTIKGGVARLQVKVVPQKGKDTPTWTPNPQPAREAGPLRDNPEGGDNAGITIPGMPPELLGPTGRVFLHPDGKTYSTHLNTTVEMDGKTAIVPLLVPGQTEINRLLEGKKPSHEQLQHALDWVKTFRDQVPTYDTPDAAKADEQAWHDWAVPQMQDWVSPFLGNVQHNTEPMDRGGRMPMGLNGTGQPLPFAVDPVMNDPAARRRMWANGPTGYGGKPGAGGGGGIDNLAQALAQLRGTGGAGMNLGQGMNRAGIGWSSPDPGSPNPHGPGPFDPGGGPGDPSYNFDPRKQTPWQRKNAGFGDTSTTLDPPTFWDRHPNRLAAQRLLQQHIVDVANQRRDQLFPGWRGRPYDPNDPSNQAVPGQNFGMAPGEARMVQHFYGNRLPTPQRGMNMGGGYQTPEQQLFSHPAFNPGRGVLR